MKEFDAIFIGAGQCRLQRRVTAADMSVLSVTLTSSCFSIMKSTNDHRAHGSEYR
jgi:hypothetical protein